MGVYGKILRVPGVAAVVLATVIGRLPIGITGLAILLYVEDVSGSFASAGVCAGALALGSAAGAPFQGRFVDRRGEGVLIPLALIHAGGLLLIWGARRGERARRAARARLARDRCGAAAAVVGAALALAVPARVQAASSWRARTRSTP